MNPISLTLPTDTTSVILPEPPGSTRRPFLSLIPGSADEFLLVLDNSSMDRIKRCHQSARKYLLLGREAHARSAALVYGGAIHQGLELFHHEQYLQQTLGYNLGPEFDSCNEVKEYAAIRTHFLNNPSPPDPFRTVETALVVMKEYRSQCNPLIHPDYEWEVSSNSSGPIIERAFELPLGVIPLHSEVPGYGHISFVHVAWSGRIDLLAKANCRVRVVDNKTTSINDEKFVSSFQLSSQTIGYVWAAQQLFPELEPSGFLLNAIYLNGVAAKAAVLAGRSVAEKGPRGGDAPLKFFRYYFDYSPERVAEWSADQLVFVSDFLHSVARAHFPLNDRACYDKFGECEYHNVCLMDNPEARDLYLLSDAFRQVTWNPTAK